MKREGAYSAASVSCLIGGAKRDHLLKNLYTLTT